MLCLALLASSLGFAQTPAESPPSSSESPLSPPPLVPAPEQTEPLPPPGESIPYPYRPSVEEQDTSRRILLEALAGGGTGIVAGIAGALSGVLLVGNKCTDGSCIIPILGSMSLGVVLGTPLGVYGVGRAMDGHGTYWAALGGTVLGSLAGLGLGAAFSSIGSGNAVLTLISLIAGPVTGAILGYELSNASTPPTPLPPMGSDSSAPGFQCVPVLGVTPTGGILGGLAGRF